MQRYSQGLAVPKQMLDSFAAGKTTGTGANVGEVTCELTYTPKSVNHVMPVQMQTPPVFGSDIVFGLPYTLTGKTLVLQVYQVEYYKANFNTSSENSGGAGADPHTHGITHTLTRCGSSLMDTVDLEAFNVQYTVA